MDITTGMGMGMGMDMDMGMENLQLMAGTIQMKIQQLKKQVILVIYSKNVKSSSNYNLPFNFVAEFI